MNNNPQVSVIIPVFNTENFIGSALQSVLDQSYDTYEIICVDDGSTDTSADVIRFFMQKTNCIRLIQTENNGQGKARNIAINEARGKYIFFLDADDKFENDLISRAVSRAEEEKSDIVIFDYYYWHSSTGKINYPNEVPYFKFYSLHGSQCCEVLKSSTSPIYSVNKMYRRTFLIDNKIYFNENYIYEDYPFWIEAALRAEHISLIHAPLYRITINKESSTQTMHNTDFHANSYIEACKKSINIINKNTQISNEVKYKMAYHFLFKFMIYYYVRTPKEYHKYFADSFLNEYFRLDFTDIKENLLMSGISLLKKYNIKNLTLFRLLIWNSYMAKHKINRYKIFFLKFWKALTKIAYAIKIKKKKPLTLRQIYRSNLKGTLYKDVILFYGFDNRYTGNSRYLFEKMLTDKPDGVKLFFITSDGRVPKENRIQPNTERSERFMARAKTVIFESWIPGHYQHRLDTAWIQLWHGTPVKRLLFDSHEKYITALNPINKSIKFKDIQRWDYLLVDSPKTIKYFKSAFLISEDKILIHGYPRVKYLLDKKNDTQYRARLKEILGLEKKKVVLYLPTWRDRNYRKDENLFDLTYLLNLTDIKDKLGEDYQIVYKDHAYLAHNGELTSKKYRTCETQELLLIADILITDYSSVIFDALAIDLPVVLYCNDFQKNEEDRGVYKDIWNDLKPLVCETQDAVVESILNYKNIELCKSLKSKYCYKSERRDELSTFIYKQYYLSFMNTNYD